MRYSYVIHPRVFHAIDSYYENVTQRYSETYSYDLLLQNVNDAYNAIYQIEDNLPRRRPIISRWKDLYMASYMVGGKTRWNFAYRIEGDTVFVEDACHAQNMHECRSQLRLTESQLYDMISECVKKILRKIA